MAFLYEQGLGVPQDYEEAVKWYRRLSQKGDSRALYNLANLHLQGKGVDKDILFAYQLFIEAA